ncbi:MAG: NifB/NifX family molybdenum-iron cluster-binding protein [Candidatus Desulfofervidus auxilii]|nr:NifB/NifX family molybdenum-iron cluster-binding protein [Candidatus Desulfofervidus auxilii]
MIAFPVQEKGQEPKVSDRFGRARYFYLTNGENGQFLKNPYLNEPGGVGIRVSQWLINQGVEMVVVKNIGLNALRVLREGQVKVFKAKADDVKENLKLFAQGFFKEPLPILDNINEDLFNCSQKGSKKCVCFNCGYIFNGQPGVPCRQMVCPKCGGQVRRLP